MKNLLTLVAKSALVCLSFTVLFSSCVPQKKIKYLQKLQEKDTTVFHTNRHNSDYRIQVRDNLYIRVFALDEKAFFFFNKQSGTSSYNDFANDASIYLNSYSVGDDGNIDFPIVGKVFVKNLTVDQIKAILQEKIGEYLKETTVVVKTVNFRITLVGEVTRPGAFTIYKDDLNIFEAISLGGDMTEFANRNRVALIRQVNGGSQVHYLDLTSEKILSSAFYYLQPNDIVYVSPLGYKRWGLGSTFPWAIVLSSVTTTLLLINYIKK
ncbi:MAG: polysaccharide biosynthesis/export family protein [Bacteroidales bacterium]|nr:polysaccharide biosynthesis/export family protein [Bacteroidales bacterium]